MISTFRVRIATTVAALLVSLPLAGGAQAEYPDRPVRVIVPFGAGGAADSGTRFVTERVGRILNQSFVVENRGGGTGTIGVETVVRAPKDGYTLLMTSFAPIAIVPHQRKTNYDPERDLVPIAQIAENIAGLAAHPSVKANNVKELVALAKAQPGTITFSSAGVASLQHFRFAMLQKVAGMDLVHVPYKSAGDATADVLAGNVLLMAESLSFVHARSGKLKLLATYGPERHPNFPDVPTLAESGFGAAEIPSWSAAFAPAGTPPEVIKTLNAAINQALEDKELQARMMDAGFRAQPLSQEAMAKRVTETSELFGRLISEMGLKE